MTCQHERLDTKGEIKTSSPPWMRCVECKEWVVARDYCHECGSRDSVDWAEVQPPTPAISVEEAEDYRRRGWRRFWRFRCKFCGHEQGQTRITT